MNIQSNRIIAAVYILACVMVTSTSHAQANPPTTAPTTRPATPLFVTGEKYNALKAERDEIVEHLFKEIARLKAENQALRDALNAATRPAKK